MRTLNRPMFRTGGSAGTGITSGLVPKRGRVDGPGGYAGETTEERLRKAAGQIPDRSLSQLLIDFGLGMASTPPTGSILTTAAQVGRAPYEKFRQAKAARAGFDRQLGLEAAKIDIGQENAMAIQELQNQGKINVAEIANDPARTATGLKIKTLQELFPDGGPEYERRLKDVIAGTSLSKDIGSIVASLIQQGQDPDEAAKIAIKIILSIQAGLNVSMSEPKASGGRAGYQMGNMVTGAMPMQASAPQGMDTQQQSSVIQMPYQEFRASIPPEVGDEVVQLIYYNQDAFADFAEITTQADVYDFNNKYGVSLVLPMSTKTT